MPESPNTPIALPHENKNTLYLTDSGLETQLVFKDNFTLPEFAAFTLLDDPRGVKYLKDYYRRHAALAASNSDEIGFVFESTTWRASSDWLKKLGYDDIQDICNKAIQIMSEVRDEFPGLAAGKGILSGNIGPRGDGYVASNVMTLEEAKEYHLPLILALKKAGADMVMAATLNYIDEGIGITLAAQEVGIPVVLSYTLETDGCLLAGDSIAKIIRTIDTATDNGPAYYMVNCSHPLHIQKMAVEDDDGAWMSRIGGIRGNASKLSHAELDEALELDEGCPKEFGKDNLNLLELLPQANVLGGCCGTDIRHVESILSNCATLFEARKEKQPLQ